jgi:tetratricopeptide (TPR) repeat protein
VPLKTELTRADLTEIRRSALGAADPLGVAAELSDAVDNKHLADQQDAGYALALAAEIAESRSKLDAALRYADHAVEANGDSGDSEAGAARALRARILFRAGRADDAMAELEALRPLLTVHADAAAYIGAALAVGGRNQLAEQWLTEAVKTTMAERGTEPGDADDAGLLFFLLQQRHRLRHVLGLPHDTHDNLAERLETRLANTADQPGAAAGDLVFFPKAEFDKVPETESIGRTWDEHRALLEKGAVAGRALYTGLAVGLAAKSDPAEYARQLATTGGTRISWPPERNAACWCGSGNKYKKCCLPRSRA